MMLRFRVLVSLSFLLVFVACSTPSWFPFQKGPPHKAKTKELVDKEVVIIDQREYVKVSNPRAGEGGDQPKVLYVPVDEYLARKTAFTPLASRSEQASRASSVSTVTPTAGTPVRETPSSLALPPPLKKKVLLAHIDDQAEPGEEVIGDWVTERLAKEIQRRSERILFVDYPMVKDFLDKRGVSLKDLETPSVLRELNEVFGVHALVVGYLAGPYVFVTKAAKDREGTASAIVKIELSIVDTLSGKILKTLTASNPVVASRERGSFSGEKAKMKAIDLTLPDLGRSLVQTMEGLDWFCRVARVENQEVFINAGRLTGVKVGDVMEVFPPEVSGLKEEKKARVRISAYLGMDASMARVIDGKEPEVNDILRFSKTGGS